MSEDGKVIAGRKSQEDFKPLFTIKEYRKKCRCCDLPDQSVTSLSRFLLVSLLASTASSVVWILTWKDIELNQYITTNEKSGMSIFVSFVTGRSSVMISLLRN